MPDQAGGTGRPGTGAPERSRATRIAFVVWSLAALGGSERVVYDIARKLDRDRYDVQVIGFEDGPLRSLYEEQGVRVHVVSKRDRSATDFFFSLNRVFREESIRVVNPHHFGPLLNTFIASRGTGARIVYTEHSRWQLEGLNPFYKRANRLMLRRSDALVAISRQIQAYYLHQLSMCDAKVHLIPNGIDLTLFGKASNPGLRGQLGIREDARVIGMVANLRPEKNHKLLVSAFSTLADRHGDITLVLAGEDSMNGEVQRFASGKRHGDRVVFLGKRDDIPGLLGIMDVCCLPSKYEGLPLTILEAMAAGVPVLGADVLGINEVIEDGSTGLLFEPGSERALIDALEGLLQGPSLRQRLSSAGRAFVARRFSLDESVKKYDRLFQMMR